MHCNLKKQKISRKILTILPKRIITRYEILPLSFENGILTIATLQPEVSHIREVIMKECNCSEVQFVLALPTHLRIILDMLDKQIANT